jgi:chemotaxis protein CheD
MPEGLVPSRAAAAATAAAPRVVTLHPGDVAWGERGDRLETLLGSCVAIILTDPRRTAGVMCHVVHARPARSTQPAGDCQHGEAAWRAMGGLLRSHAVEPRLCEAYVYGGGNMFPDHYPQANVGLTNARWALGVLQQAGIPVVHQDLGGPSYRRLAWTVGPERPRVVAMPV